jgi:hypothetical protein
MPSAAPSSASHCCRTPSVVALDDPLRDRRQRDVRRVAVIEARLLVEAEQVAADESRVRVRLAVVARVGAQGRIAARERVVRLVAGQTAVGRHDRAVVAAVDLIEVAAVPAVRQPHLEADRVRFAVRAGALVHGAAQHAVWRGSLVVAHAHGGHDSCRGQAELREGRGLAGHGGRALRMRGGGR